MHYLHIKGYKMKNIFTEHPHSINETYPQHFKFASLFGIKMIIGGLACLMHAIFPFLFKNTGSNFLMRMTHNFIARMPTIEGRAAELVEMIEHKKAKSTI